jgi:GT2 family glycosyltransferase
VSTLTRPHRDAPALAPVPPNPRVAVLVVTRDSADLVGGLLDSLHDGLAGLDWTLTVADRASIDDTLGVVRYRAPFARVVPAGRSAGHAAAVNTALAAAGALPAPRLGGWHDAVLLVEPGVRLGRHAGIALLAALGAEHRDGTRAGIAAPRVYEPDGRLRLSLRHERPRLRPIGRPGRAQVEQGPGWPFDQRVTSPGAYREATVTGWASRGALLIDTACLRVCGPWPEPGERRPEEGEYARRAFDHGYHVRLAPTARVLDSTPPTPGRSAASRRAALSRRAVSTRQAW